MFNTDIFNVLINNFLYLYQFFPFKKFLRLLNLVLLYQIIALIFLLSIKKFTFFSIILSKQKTIIIYMNKILLEKNYKKDTL